MGADILEHITLLTEKLSKGEELTTEAASELEEFLIRDPRLRAEFNKRVDPVLLDELTAVYLRANSNWEDKFGALILL